MREVEIVIARNARNEDDSENLRAELNERLDSPEFDDDFAGLPFDEIVKRICHDLGISIWIGRDPTKLTDAELATCIAELKDASDPPPRGGLDWMNDRSATHPPRAAPK